MGNLALIDELLGLAPHRRRRGVADFAATIAASNGMLIPLELLVQARLCADADLTQAALLTREYRHKSRLLDTDRPIIACVCDIVSTRVDGPAPGALAACIAALSPPAIPRVLSFALPPSPDTTRSLLENVSADEFIIRVPLDSVLQQVVMSLTALRAGLQSHPRTRVLAVMQVRDHLRPSVAATRRLSRELAARVDLVCALPLLTHEQSGAEVEHRARYLEVAQELEQAGLARLAPGLYGHRPRHEPTHPWSWLNHIMSSLPQADVLGLGPAACSRFNEMQFDNHADFAVYAREVTRGGYGIARTYASSPVEQFIEASLVKLASGSVVDVAALAMRCQCTSPGFMDACGRTFDALRASGALSGRDARSVSLEAGNDAHFGEVHARLAQLRGALPEVTDIARR